jgi:excisionase family DNA binding protein
MVLYCYMHNPHMCYARREGKDVEMKLKSEDRETREVMTVAEVADYLGVSTRLAYSLVWSGDIPHARLGPKMIRIRKADVDRYLDEHMQLAR